MATSDLFFVFQLFHRASISSHNAKILQLFNFAIVEEQQKNFLMV